MYTIFPPSRPGSVIDARSDLYSAGVVLYEMLTGTLPYKGDSPVAVALQHVNSVPKPPRRGQSGYPVGNGADYQKGHGAQPRSPL